MTPEGMQALRERCRGAAGDGHLELYKVSLAFDNPEAREAHRSSFATALTEGSVDKWAAYHVAHSRTSAPWEPIRGAITRRVVAGGSACEPETSQAPAATPANPMPNATTEVISDARAAVGSQPLAQEVARSRVFARASAAK